jgi:hypothetical protein
MESEKNQTVVDYRVFNEVINDLTALIEKIEPELDSAINKSNEFPTKLAITFDFLWRINNNLKAIICIQKAFDPVMQKPALPASFLYRSIVSDLMHALFWLSLDEPILKEEVEVNNLTYAKYYKDALDLHYELALHLYPGQQYDIQNLYDRDYDRVSQYLTNSIGEPWEFKKAKAFRSVNNSFSGGINHKKIYDYFRKNVRREINEKQHLYKYYRYLSQCEHYSIAGRDYSYRLHASTYIEMITLIFCSIKTIIEMTMIEGQFTYIDHIKKIILKIPQNEPRTQTK